MKNLNSILNRHSFYSEPTLSPLQSQVDGLVGRFVEEAANPRTLAAITAGGMAYRLGRVGVMGMGSSMIHRPLSMVVGLGAEVTAFEFTNRTLVAVTGRAGLKPTPTNNLWSWGGPGGWRDGLITSAITFGMLKGAGHLAREQNIVLQHAFQSTAMVAGHQTAGVLGVTARPEGSVAEQFLHAEATNLQLGAGMALVHSFAPGIHAWERGLDMSLRNVGVALRGHPGSHIGLPLHPDYATAANSGGNRSPEISSRPERNPHIHLMSSTGDGGGDGPSGGGKRGRPDAPTSAEGDEAPRLDLPILLYSRENPLEGEANELESREAEREVAQLIYQSLPDEVREFVDRNSPDLIQQYDMLRGRPLPLVGFALAHALEHFNEGLNPQRLIRSPENWNRSLWVRNWIRDTIDDHLRKPHLWVIAHHYEKALSWVSYPWIQQTVVDRLPDPLGEQVTELLNPLKDYNYNDPRLPRSFGVLGQQLGSATQNSYRTLLKTAFSLGLVDPERDPMGRRFLRQAQRQAQRMQSGSFQNVDLSDLGRYWGIDILMADIRESWGRAHPMVRGYDRGMEELPREDRDPLRRYQMLKRLEALIYSLEHREEDPN